MAKLIIIASLIKLFDAALNTVLDLFLFFIFSIFCLLFWPADMFGARSLILSNVAGMRAHLDVVRKKLK